MRYNAATGYIPVSDPKIRYRVVENIGDVLCVRARGTGVNDRDRQPQSRYGDASPGRGDCLHQIVVNDAVEAPKR